MYQWAETSAPGPKIFSAKVMNFSIMTMSPPASLYQTCESGANERIKDMFYNTFNKT